jgi:hypothetical protein
MDQDNGVDETRVMMIGLAVVAFAALVMLVVGAWLGAGLG